MASSPHQHCLFVLLAAAASLVAGGRSRGDEGLPAAKAAVEKPAAEKPAANKPAAAKKAADEQKPAQPAKAAAKPKPKEVRIDQWLGPLVRRLVTGQAQPAAPAAVFGGAAPVMVDADNDAVKQMAVQFQQQYRGLLHAELSFIKQTAEIPKEKRPQIKAAGEAALEYAAKETAQAQMGRRRTFNGGNQNGQPEKIIREKLSEALEAALPAEEFAKFRTEAEHRVKHRQRAAIEQVVSILDEMLLLNETQRVGLVETFNDKWQSDWEVWLMLSAYGGQYVPVIPDDYVTKHLNADQKTIWNSAQKIGLGWFDQFGDGAALDPWWNGESDK